MPFLNNNVAAGLPENSQFQVGRSNVDNNEEIEKGVFLPWASSASGSYMYYDCTVTVMLDSGIVVHTPLPQTNYAPDTLASIAIDANAADTFKGPGVNLKSNDRYQDIVQRMAHSRYWFHLSGQALRVGYRVPIPGIVTIGGVPAIPHDDNPQRAFNRIMPGGNYSGVILWHAEWSLWYTTAVPPTSQYVPEVDMAAHIDGSAKPPDAIQSPFSRDDDNAQTVKLQGFPVRAQGR